MSNRNNRLEMTLFQGQTADKYMACLSKLSSVMDLIQQAENNSKDKKKQSDADRMHQNVMKATKKIFKKFGLKVFSETLIRMMLIPFQSKPSHPFASKLVTWFFDLVIDESWFLEEFLVNSQESLGNQSLNNTLNSTIDEGAESEAFPIRILRLCDKYHSDNRAPVRLRLMQTVDKIIPSMIPVEEIRKSLQQKMIRMLLVRRKDKNEQVRAVALKILCSFYVDDNNSVSFQAQILSDLLHHLAYDPEPSVRESVISNIKIGPNTWEHVVERTGDPSENVRVAAIQRTATIKLSSLNGEMREALLKCNTSGDIISKKTEAALNVLLEEWLKQSKGDACEFLRIIDVRRRSKLCTSALNYLFNGPSQDAFERISKPLLCKDAKYLEESLSVESTFIWQYLYQRFKSDQWTMNRLKLTVSEMITYIREFVEVVEEEGDCLSPSDFDYRSWMLGDMLSILSYLPEEEGERQAILEYLPELCLKMKLIDLRNTQIVFKLIAICTEDTEGTIIDLVNLVLDSDSSVSRRPRRASGGSSKFNSTSTTRSNGHGALEDFEQLRREHGNLIHRAKKLERDQKIAVGLDDLSKANDIQQDLDALENQITSIKQKIEEHEEEKMQHEESFYSAHDTTIDDGEIEEPWVYSDKTMLIAISMAKKNLERQKSISAFSRTFYEMYVLRALAKCKDPSVRGLALELMCIVGMESESECSRVATYSLTALLQDVLIVKKAALKCLYDLVLKYSFHKIGDMPEVQKVLMGMSNKKDQSKDQIEADDPASTLRTLLLTYLRHEEHPLVKICVAGILKLLVCKREMNFTKIITKFLTNWAIPSYEMQLRFKDVSVMIPIYATMGEDQTTEVSKCLVESMKKGFLQIQSAYSRRNSLLLPDIDKITNLIVQCVHPNKLSNFQRPYIGHQTIASAVLEELKIDDVSTEEKKQYIKLLKVLDLSQSPLDSVKEMIQSANEMIDNNARIINQSLRKFIAYLESLDPYAETASDENAPPPPTPGPFDDDDDADANCTKSTFC